MNIRLTIGQCLALGWIAVWLQIPVAAQNQPSQDPPAQGSGDDSSGRTAPAPPLSGIVGWGESEGGESANDLPHIPAMLGGSINSTGFLSELNRANYLRAGINVSSTYDDNALLTPTDPTGNASVSIYPNISIQQTTSRMAYTLGYAGGVTLNQNVGGQNQQAQNVNLDSQFRLSPHVNLRVAERFSLTTGFFDSADSTGIAGGLNPSLITPFSTQRINLTTVETDYHFALYDLIGATGSFYDLHFGDVQGPTQLTNSQTASGSAFWLHHLFGRDWGGLSYRFDRITFDPSGETRVHSFNVVNTVSLGSHLTVSGLIGPQYSENEGILPGSTEASRSTGWSLDAAAEVAWIGTRTNVSAGYLRGVSSGDGVLGVSRSQNIHAEFRRQLAPRWAAAITATRATNQSVTVPSAISANSINLTSAGFSVDRIVQKSIGLRIAYIHDFQQQFGLPAPNPTQSAQRDRFVVTLSYQWAKPLGM
jgi:hypothetical protein